jgi:hypothetical protein
MEYLLKFYDISTFRIGVPGLLKKFMPNTVKNLKIGHCSTNSVWFFSWSVEIYMHVVACVPKRYPVTDLFPCIFHNYFFEAHIAAVFYVSG